LLFPNSSTCAAYCSDAKIWKEKRLTYDERKAALKTKLEAIVAAAGDEDSD
jgi:hypothetical protein